MNSDSHRHFPAYEFTSLTIKFKQLWSTGKEAKLEFKTHEGQAWGSLHVCLGEHPSQDPPDPQERPYGHETPSKQRRRERREAARLAESAAVEASESAIPEEEAAEAADADDEHCDEEHVVTTAEVATANDEVVEVTEEVASTTKAGKSPLLITDIHDEICSDEEFYEEIDPSSAFTCLQCKMEHYPENFVEGDKVLFYGLCRWHLGVYKCKNCSKNLIGIGKIRDHRRICRAPS